jgi:hypothetical protein
MSLRWRPSLALAASAAVLLALALDRLGDCSRIDSDTNGVVGIAFLMGSGVAASLAIALPISRRNVPIAAAAGVAAGIAYGVAFSLYALAADVGYCPT